MVSLFHFTSLTVAAACYSMKDKGASVELTTQDGGTCTTGFREAIAKAVEKGEAEVQVRVEFAPTSRLVILYFNVELDWDGEVYTMTPAGRLGDEGLATSFAVAALTGN